MTCEEALKKLYEIVDKEASQNDKEEIQKHLEHCRHCMSRFEFEMMFKTFITNKASSTQSTDRLKSKILDRISQAEKSSGWFYSNPFRYKSVLLAVAASLIICVLAAFATAKFYRHKTYIYPFEQHQMAHNDFATAGVDDIAGTAEIRKFVTNDLHLSLSDNLGGYVLVCTGFDNIQEQQFAHLRYINNNVKASFFVGPAEGINLPDFERSVFSGVEYFKHVCTECQVIYWRRGNAVAVVVSEDKSADLTSFIPALSAI